VATPDASLSAIAVMVAGPKTAKITSSCCMNPVLSQRRNMPRVVVPKDFIISIFSIKWGVVFFCAAASHKKKHYLPRIIEMILSYVFFNLKFYKLKNSVP
jgi:hypothetical protein